MIGGVAVLAILALALLAVLLTRDPDDDLAASSPTPTPTVGASVTPAATESAQASDGASPTAAALPLTHDTIVATLVDGLTVREDPGLGGLALGTLELGTPGFLIDGPTEADGFSWYLVSGLGLPANSGCAGELETEPFNCPIWFGWVAAASESGEPWLEPRGIECPTAPLSAKAVALGRTDLERLACFRSEPFTFRAWWPEIPAGAGLGGACTAESTPSVWLLCQNINYNYVTINENEGFGGVGVTVSIDPESGVSMPERGTWAELRVHLDDPAAQRCGEDAIGTAVVPEELPPEQIVLMCRAELVLEAAQAVDGP
jgi:hypothetical protein